MRVILSSATICCALLLLAGCASKPLYIPLGKSMAPPTGATGFCKRNPEDELCQ